MAARSAAWRPPALERVEGWQAHVDSSLMKDLTNRECRIPQVPRVSKRRSVIPGEFAKSGRHNCVVLCLQKMTSTLFVYWDWAARNPAQFARLDETIPPSKNGYYRILRVVGEKFIRRHCDASASERSDRQTCPFSDRYVSVSAFCDASRSFSWLVSFLLF